MTADRLERLERHLSERLSGFHCKIRYINKQAKGNKTMTTKPETVADLRQELKALYKHHVKTLESARDRIIELGGECDDVDVMEKRCPVLKRVRDALAESALAAGAEPVAYMDRNGAVIPAETRPMLSVFAGYDVPLYTHAQPAANAPAERESAEQFYSMTAFDYEKNPIGSHEWYLFYRGWVAGQACTPKPPASVPDGWVPLGLGPHPARNSCVVYWHKSPRGGFPAVAGEWRDEDHRAYATHWHPGASSNPTTAEPRT